MAQKRIMIEEHAAWQKPITSIIDAPPAEPTRGDRHIVGEGTGDFTGEDNNIATALGGADGWLFDAPQDGWKIFNLENRSTYTWNAGTVAWEITPDVDDKMDKQTEATADNLVAFDATGNSKDTKVGTPEYDTDLGCVLMDFEE